ncbi:MAG: glycosyltransferase [Paludibacter sp.]|nr:glycosyltransferase [Paludibacter sp.]
MGEAQTELVSIVIPAYNAEKYLEETVDSALASSYPSLEIIIVNDGSSDNTQQVIDRIVANHPQIKACQQKNQGVSVARNTGISKATGKYILPLDADDLIAPDYIEKAVDILSKNERVKMVNGLGEFFGDRQGAWNLKPFSRRLLARKNMLYISGIFRKTDFDKTDGFCPEIKGPEDWDFWISLLKRGGEVVRLPQVCLYYRIHANSKRIANKNKKKEAISILNKRHKAFFYRELGGKLHYRRTWSRLFNFFIRLIKPERIVVNKDFEILDEFVYNLPELFENEGITIHSLRNTLKTFEYKGYKIVVKSFHKPNVVNRFIYGNFRHSKARRSYDYAKKLNGLGIGTPTPIGYYEQKCVFLFTKSYYASLESDCINKFTDLINNPQFPNRNEVLKAIGRFTATIHEKGILHHDYSAGNILFLQKEDNIEIELIDLNRIEFGKVDLEKGCRNFERLNIDTECLEIMAREYAPARGFEPRVCIDNILSMRWKKHKTNYSANKNLT